MTERHDAVDLTSSAFRQSLHGAALVAVDPPLWTVLAANDAYLAATQSSREQLVGRSLFALFPESAATTEGEAPRRIRASLARAGAGETVVMPVVRYDLPAPDTPDGFTEQWWELTCAPLRDASGTVVAVMYGVDNVTERERARRERRALVATVEEQNETLLSQALELEMTNQQLQENAVELEAQTEQLQATSVQLEERTDEAESARRAAEAAERQLQTVFAQAPAAVGVTHGREHRFVLANAGYEELVGRKVQLGRTFREVLPEIAEQGFEALLDGVYRTGEPYVANEVPAMVAKRGRPPEQGYYDFVYQPLVGADGIVTGVLQQGIDVTARVRGAIALRESEAQLRTLVDAIPTLAWTARADGYIEWYNQRWYDYTGTTPKDMEGWGWQSVHDPEMLPTVMREWSQSLATGEEFEMTFPLRGADGRFRPFLTRVAPVRNADGDVVRWFGTNTDIELEHDARRAAEEANAAKMNFLATMSHELRTPLNALGGYLDLLLLGLRGPLTEEQRTDLERMRRSHHHLMTLINDVLHFAKIDTGHTQFEFAPVRVVDVLHRIEELVRPQCEAKSITCTLTVAEPSPVAQADEERLGQILLNLMGNAAKYTAPGGRIYTSCDYADGEVEVRVADTGQGIPEEKLEAIFDPFVQVGRRLNAPGEGVGLGLAISRALAEGMQGTLTVESEVGVGSTFILRLPVVQHATAGGETRATA